MATFTAANPRELDRVGDGGVSGACGVVASAYAGPNGGLAGYDGVGAGRVPAAGRGSGGGFHVQGGGDCAVAVEANIPAITFAAFGGGEEAKREVRMVAANRFNRGGAPVVRNGVLLYGPQATGRNLLAEAKVGENRASFIQVRWPKLMGVMVETQTTASRP